MEKYSRIVNYLKAKLSWVKGKKYKLALLENKLRSMRSLAIKIREDGEQMKESERAEIEKQFNNLQKEVMIIERNIN